MDETPPGTLPQVAPLVLAPEADPRLANSFRNFLTKVWRSLGFSDPTPNQLDIAHFLQYGGDRPIIMGFRGVAKSYITVPFCLWNLYRNQQYKVLTTSATGGFAEDNAAFAYFMLQNFDWLDWLRPRSNQRQSATDFDVNGAVPAKDASFSAVGIFGQITGKRADLIVGDDVETPNTAETEKSRADLLKRVSEFAAIIKPGGKIVFLGTAQTEETIYLELERRGYTIRMWPAHYPRDAKDAARLGHRLSPALADALEANPALAGTSTEPTRFDEADLARREMEWGLTEYDRQFRLFLDAGQLTAKPLKLRDLIVMDLSPGDKTRPKLPSSLQWSTLAEQRIEGISVDSLNGDSFLHQPIIPDGRGDWQEADEVLCWVDPSGGGDDETTWTILGRRGNRVFLLWQGSSVDGSTAGTLTAIAEDCKTWAVTMIEVESNFGQDMFVALLVPALKTAKYECAVEPIRAGAVQKEKRIINALEPLVTSHRLIVNAAVLRADFRINYPEIAVEKRRYYRLSYQFTRITREKACITHDDRIDGLGSGASRMAARLLLTDKESEDQGREAALEQELDKIIEARRRQGLPVLGDPKGSTREASPFGAKGGRGKSKLLGAFKPKGPRR